MNIKQFAFAASLILPVLAGCASHPIALSPVGPEPLMHHGDLASGYLQVFSKIVATPGGDDAYYYAHIGYDVYDKSGKLIKTVANRIHDYDESPTLVDLPQGNYNVVSLSESCGLVAVPVVIQANKTTIVHLDGDWKPNSVSSSNELVRLPNGEAVGWSSSITKLTD